ncbi:MAG: efflux RND transporter periplasmic adaptor subunit [Phycisphaerales bacterium]
MKDRLSLVAALILGAGAAVTPVAPAQQGPAGGAPAAATRPAPTILEFGGEKSVTRSSRDATLAFTFPAEIAEILIRGGEPVKKGDLIIRARDEEYRHQRDLQRLLAETDLEVQKAQASLDQAKVEYDAQLHAKSKGGGSKIDIDRAQTAVRLREVELEIAKITYEQQKIQLKFREAQLERNYLRAPFDGRVDDVSVDVGEVKKDSERVARVVSVNPLWIDVPTPTAQTMLLALKPGDPAWVVLDTPGEAAVRKGKVIEVAAEADPASNTRRIRVELPNPQEHPAGLTSWVRFKPPTGEWASRIAPEPVAQTPAKPPQ